MLEDVREIGFHSYISTYIDRTYDLTEANRADFFYYYYFSTNQTASYNVGYYFFQYLCDTYGEDISAKITANLAALTGCSAWAGHEDNAPLFKQYVEAATEPGVFQNFVRDVIEKQQKRRCFVHRPLHYARANRISGLL